MSDYLFKLNAGRLRDLVIRQGECWMIKTSDSNLVNSIFSWLEGKRFDQEASIEYSAGHEIINDLYVIGKFFRTLRFGSGGMGNALFYYQQRYHATENDDVQTLDDYLGEISDPFLTDLEGLLGLNTLRQEKINMLSTGEFRKAYLLKSLLNEPSLIFLDNPYTGLDQDGCRLFSRIFEYLVNTGISLVIFTPDRIIPGFNAHYLDLGDDDHDGFDEAAAKILIPPAWWNDSFSEAFELKGVNANYGERKVLHDVTWSVKRNEKWSLTGRNGAGKSTLLSFVYADNPQVYCNDVRLFGRKRGTGESIWEVKDRIGYYSSELYHYFDKYQTVESAINSIVFQNPYEKRILTSGELFFRQQLLSYFDLISAVGKRLCDLSAVNQKLVILLAVILKNAPLLILDEPFQCFSEGLIRKCLAFFSGYIKDRTFIMVSHHSRDFPEGIERHFHLEAGVGGEIALLQDIG
jgi:molybdate transport system ATP-binding protein